jgi:DNA-binding NtrC family response regulator
MRPLEARGWDVDLADTPLQASGFVSAQVPGGGLVDFSNLSEEAPAALEALLASTNIGWVALTRAGQRDDPTVRRLIRDYCFDYVTVPSSEDRIVDTVGHAYGMASLHGEHLDDDGDWSEAGGMDGIVGSCSAMRLLYRSIRKVATTDVPVFIAGESGTGKELTAKAIHARSARRDKPFVAVNCGAIPPELLQSELFGYERGAFTGANKRKIGRVEEADGGTLFLDEIGDLPLESQSNLLRFLQERKIEPLGGRDSTDVDVRIIAATHVDLDAAMQEGLFRPDLYFRLCVLRIDEPPLRVRGKDIEVLANHTLERFRREAKRRVHGFAPDAIAAMFNYGWPGNVRELINRVRRAIVMSESARITADDLELGEYAALLPLSLSQARSLAQRQAIELALLRHRGRINDAARSLGVSRVTLYRLLVTHDLYQADVKDHIQDKDKDDDAGQDDVASGVEAANS